jgi:predicted amidohydrolase YtcJ
VSNSRRKFLKGSAAAGLGVALPASASKRHDHDRRDGPEPDLVLVNGRIHTMDDENRVVSSVAMRNGRFVGVGHRAHAGPGTKVVNLHGRTVVPGLVEGHVHIVSLANRPGYHVPLESTRTIREVQEALARRRKEVPEGQWITSMGGWHPFQWVDVRRRPNLAELDAAVPDRPVFLYERFTGPAVVNSLGKAFFDAIDAGPLPHPAAVKVNVAPDGSIAAGGFVGGGPAITALYVLRTLQTFEDKKRSTLDAMNYSAQVGLTAHLDHVLFPTPGPLHPHQVLSNLDHYRMYDSWLALHREGKTFIRLQMNFLHNQGNIPALGGLENQLPELKERLRNQFQFFGDDMMMTGSIGEWAAPIGAGAVWFEAQRLVAQARWRNENSVGSLAQLAQVVDAYEKVDAEFASQGGIRDLRWMVHHVPFVSTELLDRLKALGCGVQMAAFRWVTAPQGATNVGAPFRTIVDHGIQVGIHGDGVHIAPLNPWLHIYYATTGVSSFGEQVNPGQHLTRQEALRLFTRGNAWFLRMEDKIGSIEEGKLADLVVLNKDYFRVRDEDIKEIRPVMTVVGGRIVHDTDDIS